MTQTPPSYLARLSAFIFGVIVCCFSGQALAAGPQQSQVFLFAQAKCLDDIGAPYSIPATTFNPDIYHMSVSESDETKDPTITQSQKTGCDGDALVVSFFTSNDDTCSTSPAITSVMAHKVDDMGSFIPASIELDLPAEPGESSSCMSSGSPDKCEDHPPLPTLTVIKLSHASALNTTIPRLRGKWLRTSKIRMDQMIIEKDLIKGPATRYIFPDTPPPQRV